MHLLTDPSDSRASHKAKSAVRTRKSVTALSW